MALKLLSLLLLLLPVTQAETIPTTAETATATSADAVMLTASTMVPATGTDTADPTPTSTGTPLLTAPAQPTEASALLFTASDTVPATAIGTDTPALVFTETSKFTATTPTTVTAPAPSTGVPTESAMLNALLTAPSPLAQSTSEKLSLLTNADSSASNLQAIGPQSQPQSLFTVISLQLAFADPFFNLCNKNMTAGIYAHYISQIAQPVYGVSFYVNGKEIIYKILYISGGVQLMMCIIGIHTITQKIQLKSFVPSTIPHLIPFCARYSSPLQCGECEPGYHLYNNVCYPNIPGCLLYCINNCIQCSANYYLIGNKCLAGIFGN